MLCRSITRRLAGTVRHYSVLPRVSDRHGPVKFKGNIHADIDGKLYRIYVRDCSGNQADWEDFKKLCQIGFFNDSSYRNWFPNEATRATKMKKLRDWDYDNSGQTAEGPGSLSCVKAVPVDGGRPMLIGGCTSVPFTKCSAVDLTGLYLPVNELLEIKRRAIWEGRILKVFLEVANEFDIALEYTTHLTLHPKFRGTGVGMEYLTKTTKMLIEEATKRNEQNKLPRTIYFGLCTNKQTRDFAHKMGIYSIGPHLHYPQKDGTILCNEDSQENNAHCCYYPILSKPNDELFLKTLTQRLKNAMAA